MKKKLISVGALLLFSGSIYSIQSSADPLESLRTFSQESNVEKLLGVALGKNVEAEFTKATIIDFFRLFNNEDYAAIHDTLIHDKAKVLKNTAYFTATLSEIKAKTGEYATGSQSGFGMGVYTWATDQTGVRLDKSLTLNTKTIRWQGEFENGTFYFEFKFTKDSNKLIEIEAADNQLSATFERSF